MKSTMFKDDMLQAVLDLRKTHTRRLDGLQEINKNPDNWKYIGRINNEYQFKSKVSLYGKIDTIIKVKPKYKIDDIVGIKENFEVLDYGNVGDGGDDECYSGIVKYCFDNKQVDMDLNLNESRKFNKWKNKIGKKSKLFMFDSLIRRKIQIKNIRVERVQDISESDCIKEGVRLNKKSQRWIAYIDKKGMVYHYSDPHPAFMALWDSINKKRGYGWGFNPWDFVYEFKRTDK